MIFSNNNEYRTYHHSKVPTTEQQENTMEKNQDINYWLDTEEHKKGPMMKGRKAS